MVQKRPLVGDDSCVVSSKHAKYDDNNNHLVSFLEFPSKDFGWIPYTSGKGYDGSTNHLVERDVYTETCNITELPKECTEYSSGGNSNSSWASSCTSEEDFRFSEAPFHRSVPLENDELDYPSRTLARSRDAYARLLELPPQKMVPIGSDYQAEVPEWCPYGAKDSSVCSYLAETISSSYSFDSAVDNKFCGTRVTPMPAMEFIKCDDYKIGGSICMCVDPGSITCVRHHVVEAREDLRRLLGQECFTGLGLNEMGEVVSERWSEEDEQIFEEVVMSNPSSAGKNFWDCLSAVFPSRTKMEIISYYYNVFMLRKRAKQNRSKSMNIDSDDDEWQESEDELEGCEDDTESEEDEDSVVEYASQGFSGWNGCHAGSREYGTGVVKHASNQYNTDFSDLDGIYSLSETWQHNDYGTYPMFSPSQRTLVDVWGDHDLNHSLSGTGSELQASKLKAGHGKSFAANFNGASAKGGHDFFPEPCDDKVWSDDKVWDFGYATCRSNDVEFFSTSNVMEVFGVEDFNDKARDDKLH
ncbi:AT-rich interactive domain-containing protein 2 [Heracleum sosnowskyi]|uniref:AT-rich interactive domain-containing protein 2 n=1 Tax=Heracleum sosnowskyi TaxID=360622 RepID=A0AAD8HBI4_9APIA|nr:AT-rich interactive domain-containing protein 2 [Heracleum sosnowskyi]